MTSKTHPTFSEFDKMMLRAGATLPDPVAVQRDSAARRYLAARKICRVMATAFRSAGRAFERLEAWLEAAPGQTARS